LLFPEERNGSKLMRWWDGDGAAKVLELDEHAVLLERATGTGSLTQLVIDGLDNEATRIVCRVAMALHRPRDSRPPDEIVPLERWFRDLWAVADSDDLFLTRAASVARELIDESLDYVVLHGDIHHGNVLDFGARGWLVIDPKGLVGERSFDFANMFRNPPTGHQFEPGRMERMAGVIAQETGIPEERLLRWVVAFCGLSVAWDAANRDELEGDRVLGANAAALLGI
jgi:streptomycin 6-kinase